MNRLHRRVIVRTFIFLVGATTGQTPAQALRDPTLPPAIYSTPPGNVRAPAAFKPEHLMTVNGTRYLVWNNRRYALGESIDGARIERISEDEIWLRDANGTRKLSLYSGIVKRPPGSKIVEKSAEKSAEKNVTKKSSPAILDMKNGSTK